MERRSEPHGTVAHKRIVGEVPFSFSTPPAFTAGLAVDRLAASQQPGGYWGAPPFARTAHALKQPARVPGDGERRTANSRPPDARLGVIA